MHFAILIVSQRILLQSFCHKLIGNDNIVLFTGSFNYQFQYVQQFTGISPTIPENGVRFLQYYLPFLQDDVLCNGSIQQLQQIVFLQRFQDIYLTTRQQGADDFK